jgi:hypothetical protein
MSLVTVEKMSPLLFTIYCFPLCVSIIARPSLTASLAYIALRSLESFLKTSLPLLLNILVPFTV